MEVGSAAGGESGINRSLKDDFLPEESFRSMGNYVKALSETPHRFMDRLLTRSLETAELHEIKARSNHEMKKNLTWWDLIWFGIGAVVGAGIFVLTGLQANEVAGPAIILSYVISGVSAMLSVFCYTEFAVEIPVAANDFRINVTSLLHDYGHLDPIAVVVITVIGIVAILSTKGSSRLNYISSIVHIAVILFIIIAGFTKADTKNYTPFAPFGVHGIFKSSAVLFFAYVGFDAVSTMAEETKNPARDIPIGLVGSMTIVTVAYCLLAITLCLMQPYPQIDQDAPFPVAFEAVGMNWAKYIVALGALEGMTTALLVSAVGQARYLTHIARTRMMPHWLAQINPKTGTPINATIVMLAATAIIAFFTQLDILANLLSISTLFIFMLVAIALLVRRYYVSGVTTPADRNKLIICIAFILGSSAATTAYWALSSDNEWIAYVITAPIWFLATLALQLIVPKARTPKLWGVPLVPWLPSASIAINIFLLGSIDRASFIRFAVWTAILLIYYFLVGLHASYDTAKGHGENQAAEG
ncbi:hypothetical protein SLEP1_g40711 [Rubroshorea leprosula]|uniref:Cationic amino acid transporter C-terminal domain-containing protein n=1 Tax=Rubroshorea leprosula TaxID=152421 RepID=A0AAV5L4A0_9ROSI|nr:hypothetical protein SLEP1_g40711 [Rubroshorea leprosula]